MSAGSFDWSAVLARLEKAREGLDRALAPDPARVRRILAERARALATPPAAEAEGESLEVVEFRLGETTCAIPAPAVREVHSLVRLTPVPCTPPFVAGIVNVRGEIFSVVDLRALLALRAADADGERWMVLLRADAMAFGIIADAVVGVGRIPLERIQAAHTGGEASWVRGVTPE
ncbi:MAG: chemotaxis protein CheW, partial [Thermoanaerobaculia bacterium]